MLKTNAKPNLKKFIDYVRRGEVKKVDKMLSEGLDPNFVTDDGSECASVCLCVCVCVCVRERERECV